MVRNIYAFKGVIGKVISEYILHKKGQRTSPHTLRSYNRYLFQFNNYCAIGRRDYAVILMAARFGLSASDIACLKFENLLWDTSTIKLNQVKTGKELILPLLPDVGNAIIDYIKYGRPKSEEPYIFLTQRPPYSHLMFSELRS